MFDCVTRHGTTRLFLYLRPRTRADEISKLLCRTVTYRPLIVALKCLFRRYLSDIQSFHVHDCFLLCTSQLEPCCALYHTTFLMISSEVTPKELRKNSEGIVSYYNVTGGTYKWQIFCNIFARMKKNIYLCQRNEESSIVDMVMGNGLWVIGK